MNTTELVFDLQGQLMRTGYSATAAWQNDNRDGLIVVDGMHEGVRVTARVDDPESQSWIIEEQTTSGVTMATVTMSNLPVRVVAALILEILTD